ncbi:MAG TPA: hypothetical protein PLV42_01830 [bacterium]|nr:hypothetical protein [bacterium]
MRNILILLVVLVVSLSLFAEEKKAVSKNAVASDIGQQALEEPKLVAPKALVEKKKEAAAVKEFKPESVVGIDVNADLLVAYDAAVKADKVGQENPKAAITAWGKVLSFKEKNPYLATATERKTAWERFIRVKDINEKYEKTARMDRYGSLFPDIVVKNWEIVAALKEDNAYLQIAEQRIAEWKVFIAQVDDYQAKKKLFAEQREKDRATLIKILPLEVVGQDQKREMLIKYLAVYAPYYGVEDLETLFSELKNIMLSSAFRQQIWTPQYKDTLEKECAANKPASCYLAASMTEKADPLKAQEQYRVACKGNVVTSCLKVGELTKGKEDTVAVDSYWTACAWGSNAGCYELAQLVEKGAGTEKSLFFAANLYEKSCKSGVAAACDMVKKTRDEGRAEKERQAQQPASTVVATPEPAKAAEPIPPAGPSFTANRPYFWYGVGLAAFGLASVGTGAGMFGMAASSYDNYNKMVTPEALAGIIGLSEERKKSYVAKADGYKKDGTAYNNAGIALTVIGGAAVAGGVVLMVLTGEDEPKVGFFFDGRSFMASYRVNF